MKAIIAIDDNHAIGIRNGLPWPRNPDDMRFFRETTTGHPVVMGRNTWLSLGRKLPNRTNIVLTSQALEGEQPDYIIGSLDDIPEDAFVIGGRKLYLSTLDRITEFYVSHISGRHQADTYMPEEFLYGFTGQVLHNHPTVTIRRYTR